MSFKSIQKLNVERTLTTGETVSVGILAQNRQGVFFQYDDIYLSTFGNLSPLYSSRRCALTASTESATPRHSRCFW